MVHKVRRTGWPRRPVFARFLSDRSAMSDEAPAIRLMLILPAGCTAQDAAALALAGDIAAVIAAPGAGGAGDETRLSTLARPFQEAGAAVLVEGREDLARKLDLDGAHLSGPAALKAALAALRPGGKIAGCGGLDSRHDAMEAGEAGADYVMFGDLDGPFEDTLDAVDWWAEVFEVPCVGVATTLEQAEALAEAGADFIALAGDAVTTATISALDARLRAPETAR